MQVQAITELEDDRSLLAHRSHYPALAHRHYFNYGGQGVMCTAALAKIAENFQQIELMGAFSRSANAWNVAECNLLREVIATELHVSSQTITLTENTTAGCNIGLWSVDWQRGDHLLLSDCEHYGIIAIAMELQARFGIEISYFPVLATLNSEDSDADVLGSLAHHLQPNTRMVVVSHVCWNTGQVLPLKQISQLCHRHNVLVTVDAAQSVGVLPLDLADIAADFYAFTGHKWWCGVLGVGALYVRPESFAAARPTYIGWRGVQQFNPQAQPPVQWQPNGQKFEVASSAYPLYGALRAAIAHADLWGTQQQRYDRICHLSKMLWQGLAQIPSITLLKNSPPASGLVSFAIAGKSSTSVMQQLEAEHQILIRSIPNPDCLRVSLHYLTTQAEIEHLVKVLGSL